MKIERVGRKGRWKFEKVQQGVFKHKVGHGLYDIRNDGDIDHINKMWMNGVSNNSNYRLGLQTVEMLAKEFNKIKIKTLLIKVIMREKELKEITWTVKSGNLWRTG